MQKFKKLEAKMKWQLVIVTYKGLQLSHRGRVMLCVVENIAVTQGHLNSCCWVWCVSCVYVFKFLL